jgi:hypothetical protein
MGDYPAPTARAMYLGGNGVGAGPGWHWFFEDEGKEAMRGPFDTITDCGADARSEMIRRREEWENGR